MKLIYATYNQYCNSIDITTFDNIDEPMEYARLVLDGEMQAWIDAEDSLEVW